MPDTDTAMMLRSELVALRRELARLEQQAGLQPEPRAVPSQGYRLVNPGDIVGSDDHNLVMSQVVARFSTTAARTAGVAAPMLNQLTWPADTNRVERWNGSAWVGLHTSGTVSCPAPATVPSNGTGVAVTLPTGMFAAAPIVVATPDLSNGHALRVYGRTATGFSVSTWQGSGTAASPVAQWIAVPGAGGTLLRETGGPYTADGLELITVTCNMAECENSGAPIELWADPAGPVVCGPCGMELRSATT